MMRERRYRLDRMQGKTYERRRAIEEKERRNTRMRVRGRWDILSHPKETRLKYIHQDIVTK